MYKCTVWQSYIVDPNGSVYKISEPSISCLEMPKSDVETANSVLSVLPSSYAPIPAANTKSHRNVTSREKLSARPHQVTTAVAGTDVLITKMLQALQKNTAKPAPKSKESVGQANTDEPPKTNSDTASKVNETVDLI